MVTGRSARMLATLVVAVLVLACLPAGLAMAANTEDATLEVVVESPAEAPYEGEMVLLTIRGRYRGTIARERLDQPNSQDFGWMELGNNSWSDDSSRGRQARRFERRMAIFARRSGRLEIPSFVHHLTLLDDRGRRYEMVVRSEPVEVQVRPRPGNVDWWLPARSVRITESWDRPPDRAGPGELARRSVTLEAEGVGPQQLPPPPVLHAVGVVAFTDPEERTTRLTPDGPVSSVTWHWTVKPISDAEAVLEAVTFPWFDTLAREPREAVVPAQTVGLARAALEEDRRSLPARLALPGGLTAGLVLGLLLLLPGLRPRSRPQLVRLLERNGLHADPEVRALRRAARRGDPAAVRSAAYRLLGSGRRAWHRDLPPAAAIELARLDRLLFGPPHNQGAGNPEADQDAGPPHPELRILARALLKARRSES